MLSLFYVVVFVVVCIYDSYSFIIIDKLIMLRFLIACAVLCLRPQASHVKYLKDY